VQDAAVTPIRHANYLHGFASSPRPRQGAVVPREAGRRARARVGRGDVGGDGAVLRTDRVFVAGGFSPPTSRGAHAPRRRPTAPGRRAPGLRRASARRA
jgi:hypothetical protein